MRARGDTEQVATLSESNGNVERDCRPSDLREAADLLAGEALFLDVREHGEWDLGHVPGALHIPLGILESRTEGALPDRDREVVVYCARRPRSARGETLRELGYERSRHLSGGFDGVEAERLPVVVRARSSPTSGAATAATC